MPDNLHAFQKLYLGFSQPLSEIDCGQKCGPHNEYGVPVCCDIDILVPTAFMKEWEYLEGATDLWQQWEGLSTPEGEELLQEMQPGQVPLECLGHNRCQRDFRTISCRSFPFYPYLDGSGSFVGLAYYSEYLEQCWILSNLSLVSIEYKKQFQMTYDRIFKIYPETHKAYRGYSAYVRNLAESDGNDLILLDFYGLVFRIDPKDETIEELSYMDLETFGPFNTMKGLEFPDEIEGGYGSGND